MELQLFHPLNERIKCKLYIEGPTNKTINIGLPNHVNTNPSKFSNLRLAETYILSYDL